MYELNDPATLLSIADLEGPTLTAGRLIAALSLLDPNTPVIAYSDKSDYINVTDVHYSPDEGPAAVLELTDNYDSRQW